MARRRFELTLKSLSAPPGPDWPPIILQVDGDAAEIIGWLATAIHRMTKDVVALDVEPRESTVKAEA
jgi:hypothetical protein